MCAGLRKIHVSNAVEFDVATVAALADTLSGLPFLEDLGVKACCLCEWSIVRVVSALARLTGFTSLNISENRYEDSRETITGPVTISLLPHLKFLSANMTLMDCTFDTSAWVASMTTLTRVELGFARMEPRHVRSMTQLKDFQAFNGIDVSLSRPSAVSRAMRTLEGLTRLVISEHVDLVPEFGMLDPVRGARKACAKHVFAEDPRCQRVLGPCVQLRRHPTVPHRLGHSFSEDSTSRDA